MIKYHFMVSDRFKHVVSKLRPTALVIFQKNACPSKQTFVSKLHHAGAYFPPTDAVWDLGNVLFVVWNVFVNVEFDTEPRNLQKFGSTGPI